MTLKKCDKCGNTHKPDDWDAGRILLFVNNSSHPSWPDGKNYDFCPKCIRTIKKLIKELKNEAD